MSELKEVAKKVAQEMKALPVSDEQRFHLTQAWCLYRTLVEKALAPRPVREEVGEELMDLRAEIVTTNAMLAKVESENERLRQIVVDTDTVFTMIDEYLSDLPPVLPEEKKILSLVNKLMGERMAIKAVESALRSHPDTAERLREAKIEELERAIRVCDNVTRTSTLPTEEHVGVVKMILDKYVDELRHPASLLPPSKITPKE